MLTERQRADIVRLKDKCWTWKAIAEAVDEKSETVRKFYNRWKLNKDLPPKVVIKKSVITAHMGLTLKTAIQQKNRLSLRKLPGLLTSVTEPGTTVPSVSTIRRYLLDASFIQVIATPKPLLREANIIKRIKFAHDQLARVRDDPEHFSKILWSDETSVTAFPKKRQLTIWVPRSMDKADRPINPTVQAGGFSVMFWGCFSKNHLGPLLEVQGKINGAVYLEMLKDDIVPELEASEVPLIYMQDNAPVHKTKDCMAYLRSKDISTLDWPPQSPDLNPIENVWALIKHRLYSLDTFPKNREELIDRVFEIWGDLDLPLLKRLADSVPKRLKEVIKLKGRSTGH